MERKKLAVFLLVSALLVFAAGVLTQAVIGQPSASSVGSVYGGDSVWWTKAGVGSINVTPAVASSGNDVDFVNDFSAAGMVDVGAWFENEAGLVKVFRVLRLQNVTEYAELCSTEEIFNETIAQLQNTTTCSLEPSVNSMYVWVNVDPETEVSGGKRYYYLTVEAGEPVKAVVKANEAGSVKYSVIVKDTSDTWSSSDRVEVDPVVNGVEVPAAVFYSSYDADTSDEAANPSTVTAHGSPVISSSVFKVGTGSLYLDKNSWLTLPRNDIANKTNLTGNMTITAWINVTQTGVYSSIIGESTSRTGCGSAPAGNCGTYFGLWSVSNHLSGGIAHTNTTNSVILNGGSTINQNTWYFVVWRYDVTANNFSLILNAAETQKTTPSTAFNNHPAGDYFTIGNKSEYIPIDGTEDAFKGHIDEICIFDAALNVTQINALYSSGTGEPCPVASGGSSVANESQGDDAIEAAIDSSVPSATKYPSQQVYVVNASNVQKQGTVDFMVVQNSPQRRWLINYVTSGETPLAATNLSNTVLVLEIANKTAAEITGEVGLFLNATK